jgi:hypothetical protein
MQKEYKDIRDDPDYDLFGLEAMYTDTDYKMITYNFGDNQIQLYALKAASTDIDKTG